MATFAGTGGKKGDPPTKPTCYNLLAMSHYSTLGVLRNASSEDIKRAYRKLAMKHHPDRHTGVGAKLRAETQFKAIQTAYDVLGSVDKRRYYDASQTGPTVAPTPTRSGNLDLQAKVVLDMQQWYDGGRTRVDLPFVVETPCTCAWRDRPGCVSCSWTGVHVRRHLMINLPARVHLHSSLIVPGAGLQKGAQRGDLNIAVQVLGMGPFTMDGLDLQTDLEIEPAVLRFGGTARLHLFQDKELHITVPARTKRSSKLRLRGLGMSVNHESGDIFVHVKPYKAPTLTGKVLGWSLYAQLGAKAAWHEASNAMRQALNF